MSIQDYLVPAMIGGIIAIWVAMRVNSPSSAELSRRKKIAGAVVALLIVGGVLAYSFTVETECQRTDTCEITPVELWGAPGL